MGKTSLARSLRDRAQEHGHTERALAAALVAVRSSADLADYQAVQALASERWPTLRDDLIKDLRDLGSYDQISGKVDIFLHEGLYDDAIAAVEANPDMYEMAETVADQVIQHRPNWVIGYSQRQAARIIAAAKADRYAYAVHWLQRARDAARVAGKEAAWRDHMRQMIDAHRRKYKLVPMLEDLLRRKD